MQSPNHRNVAEFLANHQAIVCKIARSFAADPNDFDDLFQEICIGLWAAFEKIPDDVRESTFVYRVALNRAISWQRKRNTYHHHLSRFWRSLAGDKAGVSANEKSECDRIDLLYEAIRRLKESDRVLMLMVLDEASTEEMSEVIGVHPVALRKRISRAKRTLAKLIAELEKSNHDI